MGLYIQTNCHKTKIITSLIKTKFGLFQITINSIPFHKSYLIRRNITELLDIVRDHVFTVHGRKIQKTFAELAQSLTRPAN
jgi:hypothetical protein